MVGESYAYFLKLAPTHFALSQSSISHVSLRVILLLKTFKIIAKTIFCDSLMVEHFLIRVCLHATARELRSGSEKSHSQLIVIHMRNTTQQGETRRVTQKTPLKKPRYIKYSSS